MPVLKTIDFPFPLLCVSLRSLGTALLTCCPAPVSVVSKRKLDLVIDPVLKMPHGSRCSIARSVLMVTSVREGLQPGQELLPEPAP